eukprot:1177738-Prorocentrum_minimum.AAC.3
MLNKALGAGTVRQRCHATWGISKGLSPCKLVWPHEPDGRLVSAHQLRRYRGITKAEDISQMKRSQAGDKHQSFVDAVDMPANKQRIDTLISVGNNHLGEHFGGILSVPVSSKTQTADVFCREDAQGIVSFENERGVKIGPVLTFSCTPVARYTEPRKQRRRKCCICNPQVIDTRACIQRSRNYLEQQSGDARRRSERVLGFSYMLQKVAVTIVFYKAEHACYVDDVVRVDKPLFHASSHALNLVKLWTQTSHLFATWLGFAIIQVDAKRDHAD